MKTFTKKNFRFVCISASFKVRPSHAPWLVVLRSKLSKEVGVRAAAVGPCIHESSGFTIHDTITKESEDADIIEIAARYCHVFVNIHPFEDDNG